MSNWSRMLKPMVILLVFTLLAAACSSGSDEAGPDTTAAATSSTAEETGTTAEETGTTAEGTETEDEDAGSETWHATVEGGEIEIAVLQAEGTSALEFIEEVAAGLEADYAGTEVTLTFGNTKVQPALEQRRRGGDPLDVEYWLFDGTSAKKREWAEVGELADLKPYMEQVDPETGETWLSQFSPAATNFMTSPDDNGVYAVPTELMGIVLFYNAKMFRDLGLEPPTTWDELMTVSEAIKSAGIDPIVVSGLINFYLGLWTDYAFVEHVGYDKVYDAFYNGEGSVLDDPGYLEALKDIKEIADRGFFLEGFEGGDFTAVQTQFFMGDGAMILMGTYLVSEMADVIPEDFELAVVPFPTITDGNGDHDVLLGSSNQMSLTADSDVLPLGLEYLRRLTSKETQTRRAQDLGQISPIIGVPPPYGMDGIEDILAGGYVFQPRYLGLLGTETWDVYYPQVQAMLVGGQSPEDTLKNIDAGLKQVFGN